jgi:protocatechuate 3,4-dioxygenase, alpha subunit
VNLDKPVTPECIGSQTVGPYYAIGLDYLVDETMAAPGIAGRHITISGTIFDANGEPIPDAVVELWQASAEGIYSVASPAEGFFGFTRLSTHDGGRFKVHTIEPGSVPYLDGRAQAPHIVVLLFMRGLMRHLVTRIYLPDHPMNDTDPVLQLLPAERRPTLIAYTTAADTRELRWDIHLQGDKETVFFQC